MNDRFETIEEPGPEGLPDSLTGKDSAEKLHGSPNPVPEGTGLQFVDH